MLKISCNDSNIVLKVNDGMVTGGLVVVVDWGLPSQQREMVNPGIASPGRDPDSGLLVRLLNAYHLRITVTSESCRSNRHKSGTICNWF